MAKGTKLSEFEKSEITAQKSVRKSQRKISKALRYSKTIIRDYLKSPNKYGIRKPTGRPGKLSSQFKRRIVHKVKKKTLSTSKILKSLVNAPCSTRTNIGQSAGAVEYTDCTSALQSYWKFVVIDCCKSLQRRLTVLSNFWTA